MSPQKAFGVLPRKVTGKRRKPRVSDEGRRASRRSRWRREGVTYTSDSNQCTVFKCVSHTASALQIKGPFPVMGLLRNNRVALQHGQAVATPRQVWGTKERDVLLEGAIRMVVNKSSLEEDKSSRLWQFLSDCAGY